MGGQLGFPWFFQISTGKLDFFLWPRQICLHQGGTNSRSSRNRSRGRHWSTQIWSNAIQFGRLSEIINLECFISYFHHYLGKWSNLTSIFQMGWNHQLEKLGGDFNQCFIITLNMTHLVSPKGCIRWMGKDIWRNHHNWGRIWGNPSLQFLARWRNLLRFLKTSKRTQEIFGKKRYPTALEDLNDHTDLIFAGRKILEGQFVVLGIFDVFLFPKVWEFCQSFWDINKRSFWLEKRLVTFEFTQPGQWQKHGAWHDVTYNSTMIFRTTNNTPLDFERLKIAVITGL